MSKQIKSGVYIITNTENGDCYIGSSSDIDRRLTQHKAMLMIGRHHSKLLQVAWNKYGEIVFTFDALELVTNSKDLAIIEQRYIDKLHPQYNSARIALRNASSRPKDSEEIERRELARMNHSTAQGTMYMALRKAYDDLDSMKETIIRHDDVMKIITTIDITDVQRQLIKTHCRLAMAAYDCGIITMKDFTAFMDHGYAGLYDGENRHAIAARKGLDSTADISDYMGTLEMSANGFSAALATEKLLLAGMQGIHDANAVFHRAGSAVRKAMKDTGVPTPENLPNVPHIRHARRELHRQEQIEKEDRIGLWSTLDAEKEEKEE